MSQEGFVAAVDGAPIYYRSMGVEDSRAPTLVFYDGVGCAGYAWRYLIEHFRDDHRLVHWHYRGHGLSGRPRDFDRLGIADLARDGLRVLDHLGIERGVLIGHSMGVQVILETYRLARERVVALVPICGSYGHVLDTLGADALGKKLLPYLLKLATHPLTRGLVQGFWSTTLPTSLAYTIAEATEINPKLVKPEDFVPYLQHLGEMEVEVFLRCLEGAAIHTAGDILGSIDVPTLIISGQHDGMTPTWLSKKMHAEIPGAEILFIPSGSHTAPIEVPELIELRLEKFFIEHGLEGESVAPPQAAAS